MDKKKSLDIDKKVSSKKNTKSKKKKTIKKLDNSFKGKIIRMLKNKEFIINILILILNLGLIIYTARGNIVNYVSINGKDFFVGKTSVLFFGRNYVSLVITLFMYVYWIVVDRFFFKNKFNIKKYLLLFILLLIFNLLMFCLFTNRVY